MRHHHVRVYNIILYVSIYIDIRAYIVFPFFSLECIIVAILMSLQTVIDTMTLKYKEICIIQPFD